MLSLLLTIAALAPTVPDCSHARVLFVRGGSGTGGFLEGGWDEHLGDIQNFSESNGNHGWGTLAQTLAQNGFVCDQVIEGPATNNTPIDFATFDLTPYDIVVLGSNNADYTTAQVDGIENFVLQGGGLLVISDANWGSYWGDAPTSDQPFLTRFGMIMNQDLGTYTLKRAAGDYVVNGTDMGNHPILIGPDGLPGTADDVNEFDGEGVSPITVRPATSGLNPVVLAKAKNTKRLNNNPSGGTVVPVSVDDGALVVVSAGMGRVAGHFDRNTFFNQNGAGTSIHRFDNRQYAINLFSWLAGGANGATTGTAFCFGDASNGTCPCSNGGAPGHGCGNSANSNGSKLSGSGTLSVGTDDFVLSAIEGVPNRVGVFIQGDAVMGSGQGAPFGDGVRCTGGSIVRLEVVFSNDEGCSTTTLPLAATGFVSAGDARLYQHWYRDPSDEPTPCAAGQGSGFNLSNGLQLIWLP